MAKVKLNIQMEMFILVIGMTENDKEEENMFTQMVIYTKVNTKMTKSTEKGSWSLTVIGKNFHEVFNINF